MIEIFVGLIVYWLYSKLEKKCAGLDEYYPFMYDHFSDNGSANQN